MAKAKATKGELPEHTRTALKEELAGLERRSDETGKRRADEVRALLSRKGAKDAR